MNRLNLPLALVLSAALCLVAPLAAPSAQQAEPETTTESKKERKRQAKEERIAEYLRKKEERRARRDMERQLKEERKMLEAAPADEGTVATAAVETPPAKRKAKRRTALPRELERTHNYLWDGPLGQDPTVQAYLRLIENGAASPHQIAAFGNFLGEAGMSRAALQYYDLALRMEDEDALLWLNAGTLLRQIGQYKDAGGAYARALDIDPNNAFAHYNLGAVLDELGDYKEAVEEYKIALTLDPSLGDPSVNPQAANNDRLIAVKLMLYKEQAGSLGLPLVEIPGGKIDGAQEASEKR